MAINDQKRVKQARRLRHNQTPAEARLWQGLRGRRLLNHKFNRQYPIGPFTVDFLCRDARLIIEVDGATHSQDHEITYDERRTAFLKAEVYRIIRVLNDDVYRRFNDVMDMIVLALEGRLPEEE